MRTLDCDTPVKFWEHINGDWVKLTLYPGQTLEAVAKLYDIKL